MFLTSPQWVLILLHWYYPDSSLSWLNFIMDWFSFAFTNSYGELETIIETVWMGVCQCGNPESGRSSYINIFWDRRTQWSTLIYIDYRVLYWYLFSYIITWLSEFCLTTLIALFWNFLLMICNFPQWLSHTKNIQMSTLFTIIITY